MIRLAPGLPDPNTPLCVPGSAADQSWAMPGAIGDPSCHPDPTVADGSASWVASMNQGLGQMIKSLSTFWINTPSPTVMDSDYQVSGAAGWLATQLSFYTLGLMVLAIIVQGARIAIERRGDGFKDLGVSLLRYVMVSTIGVAIVGTLLVAGDQFSQWILDNSVQGSDFVTNLGKLMTDPTGLGQLSAAAAVILFAFGIIVALLQCVLMLIRSGVLLIMIGTWPLSASAAALQSGREWFTKQTAWILAFVLYKPAAAIVYAVAFRLMGQGTPSNDPVITILTGIALMSAAILTLPALIKLTMSHTAPVASGKGAGPAVAGAASMALLVGAR